MAFGTVTERDKTRNGNPKLKIDGKWMFVGKDANTDGVEIGTRVEYETHMFGDKGNLISIDRIRPAPNGNGSHAPASHGAPANYVPPPYDEAELRFISNVVGSALTAKTIQSPTDIKAWTLAAREALQALKGNAQTAREPGQDDESENPAAGMQQPQQQSNGARRW